MDQELSGNGRNRPEIAARIASNQAAQVEALGAGFDFIVCGAGASGSVIAGRLAANSDVRVLLIEAGGSDELQLVMDPNLWVRTIGSELDWGFVAAPILN
jgi:choline dehydrogenase